jgi:hypothetical protein
VLTTKNKQNNKNESFYIIRKKNKKANLQINLIDFKICFWRVKLLKANSETFEGENRREQRQSIC